MSKMVNTCAWKKAALAGGSSLVAFAAFGASPAAAQTVCLSTPLGVLNCAPTSPSAVINLPGQTQPITVTLPSNLASTTPVLVNSTGPVTVVGEAVVETLATGAPALQLTSGTNIVAQVTALSTAGDNAPGALLNAADSAVLVVDETVSTLGNSSDGINITAGSINVTVGQVTTAGVNSDGVQLVAVDGPAVLNANLIETLGDGSTAALIRAVGDIGVNVGVLRTEGDEALGLDLRSRVEACAVLGAGSCDVSAVVGTITTEGFGSIGALVVAAGDIDLDIDVLQTGGDQAAGLDLRTDPTACVAFGVGGCDTAFTVNNLTTSGASAPGVLVRAVGDIDGSVGVLSTSGEDAIGLDLASDPEACVILGAGACSTSFSVGQLTTSGAGAIGALVRAAGPVSANVGVLETLGDGATGLDIAADPEACLILGLGQCTTQLTGDSITTSGDLAGGVLVNSPGQIVADLGSVSTGGNGSPGITLINNAELCLLIGAGACGITLGGDGTTGPGTPGTGTPGSNTPGAPGGTDVDTDGDDSPGVVVITPGPIDIDLGDVDTGGDNSPGVVVGGGEERIEVTFDTITTGGVNSPGIDVTGTGRITVVGGPVTTGGDDSPGVMIVGADDPVLVSVGPVTTSGANSNGIDVETTSGNQAILAGPITVTGPGNNGIDSQASGCAELNIVATGPINAVQGTGINASSACNVNITTQAGAPVSGGVAGINAVSGTGTTVTIGDNLTSTGGPALNVDGAAATVVIQPTGTLNGSFDLTDANDRLTNNGTLVATAGSSFGGGIDALVNNGTIRATGGAVTLAGLESTANTGLIDLRDGATNDTLTLPGSFVGSGASGLAVDVGSGTGMSDRLVIGGAATGSTTVFASGLNGGFVNNAIVVDAGAGTSAGAFVFTPSGVGLVDYSLVFSPAANDFALFGTPNASAVSLSLLAEGARQVFYRTNDTVAAHLGAGSGGGAAMVDETPQISRAVWLQTFGMIQERDNTLNATPFGQARRFNFDSEQDFFGVQMGADLFGAGSSVFGVTAGYTTSELDFDAVRTRFDYQAANAGVYGRVALGGFNVRGLVKYEHYWIDVKDLPVAFALDTDGEGWGGWLEAGYRFGGPSYFVEPVASIEYANINIDGFDTRGIDFAFDEAEGLRGKAGLRFGAVLDDSPSRITAYGSAQAIHEFEGEDRLTLSNSGLDLDFDQDAPDTYGRATLGVEITMPGGVRGFIEGSADFAGDVSGGGARGGLSVPF